MNEFYYSEKYQAFFFVYEDLGEKVRGFENFNMSMDQQNHCELSKKYLKEEGYKLVGEYKVNKGA